MSFLDSLFKSIKQVPKILGELVPQQQPQTTGVPGWGVSLPQNGAQGDMPVFTPNVVRGGLEALPNILSGGTAPFNPNGVRMLIGQPSLLGQGANRIENTMPEYPAPLRGGEVFAADDPINPPTLTPPDIQASVSAEDAAYNDLLGAINAPIEKQKWWKDGIAKGAAIGSNVLNNAIAIRNNRPMPQQMEVQGWGRLEHDRNVDKAAAKYQPIQVLGQQNRKKRLEEAQITNAELQPVFKKQQHELNQQKVQNQYLKQQQDYEKFLKAEEGKDRRAGAQTKIQEVDGYLFRAYPNDPTKPLEPITDPRTGKQAFNPANVAQEITFDDGTKAWAKGGQIVAGKFAADRQAKDQRFTAARDEAAANLRIALKEWDTVQESVKNARDESQKKEAEARAEETRKRILRYQQELENE